jgi:putative thiamine transport system substrate-binding protein
VIDRRTFTTAGIASALPLAAVPSFAQSSAWADIVAQARGQTVHFAAWAGSDKINDYLAWANLQLREAAGVTLTHVKVNETAEVVRRVQAEKQAGRVDGSVDLMWVNGENFVRMKQGGLLFGPFAESLPNYKGVDVKGKPTTRVDFGEPVNGMEAPWGMAQLTFFGDRARVAEPPRSAGALLAWMRKNPGRFTYPKPPQFHGTTFVKQLLVELNPKDEAVNQPVTSQTFDRAMKPVWAWLDEARPLLWRKGKSFPANDAELARLLGDGELAIALTFNPNAAANLVASKALPATVQAWQHEAGTIGNTHFVAIPFNARAKAGAQVAANFLLSPLAQARKADVNVWGDPTVLAPSALSSEDRARFETKVPGALLEPAPALREPHVSWVEAIEKAWAQRYTSA